MPYADLLVGGLGMQLNREKECSVCLAEFKEQDKVVQCKNKHVFHEECLSDWIKTGANIGCPVCRVEIEP